MTMKSKQPTTSYLSDDKTWCLSCKKDTKNASDTFKLTRGKRNWTLVLRCAECGKKKCIFLNKQQSAKLPKELQDAEEGTSINKSDYGEKYGGFFPLLALIPALALAGKIATVAAGAATVAAGVAVPVLAKQKADAELEEQRRHNLEVERLAKGNGVNGLDILTLTNAIRQELMKEPGIAKIIGNGIEDDEEQIRKAIQLLEGKGFMFYS